MADDGKVYRAAQGVVAFEPRSNEYDGRTFRDVTIEIPNPRNPNKPLRLTFNLFDNYPNVQVERGDFVFGRGVFKTKPGGQDESGEPITYYSIDAYNFGVQKQSTRTDTRNQQQGAARPASSTAADDAPPF